MIDQCGDFKARFMGREREIVVLCLVRSRKRSPIFWPGVWAEGLSLHRRCIVFALHRRCIVFASSLHRLCSAFLRSELKPPSESAPMFSTIDRTQPFGVEARRLLARLDWERFVRCALHEAWQRNAARVRLQINLFLLEHPELCEAQGQA